MPRHPRSPAEKVADVFRRSRNIAGELAVIIVTEINGTLYAQIIQAERVRNLGQDSRGVTTVASASGVTQPETAHEDLTIGTFLQYAQIIPNGSVVLEGDLSPV